MNFDSLLFGFWIGLIVGVFARSWIYKSVEAQMRRDEWLRQNTEEISLAERMQPDYMALYDESGNEITRRKK